MSKLRIVVITQNDDRLIPNNIRLLSEVIDVEILAVLEVTGGAAMRNKAILFLKGFGFVQFIKLFLKRLFSELLNFLDAFSNYRLRLFRSIKSAAHSIDAKYLKIRDPNQFEVLEKLRQRRVDLIVSFSAPCIFHDELLNIPTLGCVNLHCSLLPKHAGVMPSFWALYRRDRKLGITIHLMDDKIDNGAVISQESIRSLNDPTIYDVITETKDLGGRAMVRVVTEIARSGRIETITTQRPEVHNTWPSLEHIRKFAAEGGRLI